MKITKKKKKQYEKKKQKKTNVINYNAQKRVRTRESMGWRADPKEEQLTL